MFGCEENKFKYRNPSKADVCLELLRQRENARYNSDRSSMISTDSMLLRCGCDTLK